MLTTKQAYIHKRLYNKCDKKLTSYV